VAALFAVDDPYELNALVRALLAAKFHAPEDGLELPGSPLLAKLCERAADALAAAQATGLLPGFGGRTRAAGAAPPPEPVVASARRHLSAVAARGGNWAGWWAAERAEYVRLVFRPYVADDALVLELATSGRAEPGAAADGGA
jgi:hypothetical protein